MNLTSVLLNRNKCMKYFLSLVDCIHAEGFGFIHMGFYLYTDKKVNGILLLACTTNNMIL